MSLRKTRKIGKIQQTTNNLKIETIHIINLEKDKDRWNSISRKLQHMKPTPQRWEAVYGKDLKRIDLHNLGVGFAMVHSGKGTYSEQHKDMRNLGTVGCFLSHKALLSSLSHMNLSDEAAHLILEDDIEPPKSLFSNKGRLHKAMKLMPQDWDIIYLGISNPIGKPISSTLWKLEHATKDEGNWGTHAYLVKHKSLKEKVLPWLSYMIDALDLHLNIKFNEWNVYAIQPDIIKLNKKQAAKSTIQTM